MGDNLSSTTPTMQVSIPKSLQSGNFEVSSSGNDSIGNKTLIKDFTISQQRITSNTKDTVLQILLNKGIKGTVQIKATDRILNQVIQTPTRNWAFEVGGPVIVENL